MDFSERLLRFGILVLFLGIAAHAGCDGGQKHSFDSASIDLLPQLGSGALVANFIDPGAKVCQPLLRGDWHAPETTPDGGTQAWTKGPEAYLYLPVEKPGPGHLVLDGFGLKDGEELRRVEILVNGRSLGTEAIPSHSDRIDWPVPAHTLRAGLNEVQIKVDRTILWDGGRRQLGVFVDLLQYVPEGAVPQADPYEPPKDGFNLDPGLWRTARLVHRAGSNLSLNWSGQGPKPPTVTISALPGGEPLIQIPAVGPDETGLRLQLPDDLPGFCWLTIKGQGIVLSGINLELSQKSTDIVLIVIDTLRPDYLGCYGYPGNQTPAIDQLASEGILFENAFCHSPITGPSHTNMFTSRLPSETGIVNNARGRIPERLPLLAEILAGRGYASAAVISISNIKGSFGFNRGFTDYCDRMDDFWILPADSVAARLNPILDGLGSPGFLFAHYSDPHEPYDAHGLVESVAEVRVAERLVATIPISTYTPTRLNLDVGRGRTPVTISSDSRFFLRNLALRDEKTTGAAFDPPFEKPPSALQSHTSILTTKKAGKVGMVVHANDQVRLNEKVRERYQREVAYCDGFVGALIDSLKAAGRYDDSLIIFTSDHGEALGDHGEVGHVETLYDSMMRIPLIIKPPRGSGFDSPTRRRDQAALVDLVPTVLAHLGNPALQEARGRDLLAEGAEEVKTAIFLETHRPEASRDLYGLRTDGAKIIHEPETENWEFYDLEADPKELENLAGGESEAFRDHRRMLLEVMATMDLATGLEAAEVEVDERTKEMLRSLGY